MIRFVYFILIFYLLFLFSYGKKHYIACGQCEEAIPTSFAECLVEGNLNSFIKSFLRIYLIIYNFIT